MLTKLNPKNWNLRHLLVWVFFLGGLLWAGGSQLSKLPAGQGAGAVLAALLPFLIMAVTHSFTFAQHPPEDPVQALQEGEQAAGGVAGRRGFALMRLVGALAVVGILGALVCAGHARRAVELALAEGQGCAFWKQEEPTLVQDGSADGLCVLQQVLGGATDPSVIGQQCKGLTISQVAQVVTDLATYFINLALGVDAGTVAAAPPPYKGLPASIAEPDLARLVATRDYIAARASR